MSVNDCDTSSTAREQHATNGHQPDNPWAVPTTGNVPPNVPPTGPRAMLTSPFTAGPQFPSGSKNVDAELGAAAVLSFLMPGPGQVFKWQIARALAIQTAWVRDVRTGTSIGIVWGQCRTRAVQSSCGLRCWAGWTDPDCGCVDSMGLAVE